MTAAVIGLLAQGLSREDKLHAIERGLRTGPSGDSFIWLGAAVLALVTLLLMVWRIFGREGRDKLRAGPDMLALALDKLGLKGAERELLKTVARRANLAEPAAMIMSPANLKYALTLALSGGGDPAWRRQVERLSRQLFGEGLPRDG